MKTLVEMIKDIEEWFELGGVGNIVIFRSPRANYVDSIYEETIKLFEMDHEAQELVRRVFDLFGAEKMEFFRNSDGDPDRVKVIRRG